MTILLSKSDDGEQWQQALRESLPEMRIYIWPEVPEPEKVQYALVWKHPLGDLQNYPHLRAVFSLGAGMEHLLTDAELPDVPLVSLGDPLMAQDMANHTLYWVINYHRHYDQYRLQQTRQQWQFLPSVLARDFKVLVLGLGRIGMQVAATVQQAGFSTRAWDFKPKQAAVDCYAGTETLPGLLADTDVVVCCLALNQRSRHLLNDAFFACLAAGSYLINISRGDIVDEDALYRALDAGKLAGAALDVVQTEPLPEEHWLWLHPAVSLTPHMAGPTHVRSGAKIIAANILRMEQGLPPEPVFDRSRGVQV